MVPIDRLFLEKILPMKATTILIRLPLARALLSASLSWAVSACGEAAVVRTGPIIPPLTISVDPASLTLAPGQSVILTAHARGGEAIRLFVDWTIQEGNAAGGIVPVQEAMDGSSSVKFTAATVARPGPVHVVASIRRFPAIRATVTVN